MLRLCLLSLCLWGSVASKSGASLSEVPIVSGLAQQLQGIFPEEPTLAVQTAVADGLLRAIGDEGIDLQEVSCNRDYSHLCPQGWADAGDGSSCMAPANYQGECGRKLEMGGLTPLQKRGQAARCGALYSCLGACTSDLSKPCPLGWRSDVNHDCLAPVGYSGPCVGRKNFHGMKHSERELWARTCDVKWPCREAFGEASAIEKTKLQGASAADCASDYSQACPNQFVLKGSRCEAPVGFSGRCGFSLSSEYGTTEKASYAEACLTPWPCSGEVGASLLKWKSA